MPPVGARNESKNADVPSTSTLRYMLTVDLPACGATVSRRYEAPGSYGVPAPVFPGNRRAPRVLVVVVAVLHQGNGRRGTGPLRATKSPKKDTETPSSSSSLSRSPCNLFHRVAVTGGPRELVTVVNLFNLLALFIYATSLCCFLRAAQTNAMGLQGLGEWGVRRSSSPVTRARHYHHHHQHAIDH